MSKDLMSLICLFGVLYFVWIIFCIIKLADGDDYFGERDPWLVRPYYSKVEFFISLSPHFALYMVGRGIICLINKFKCLVNNFKDLD